MILNGPSRSFRHLLTGRGVALLVIGIVCLPCRGGFRIRPFLQNPSPTAMTVVWFSEADRPGVLRVAGPELTWSVTSTPGPASALGGNPHKPESSVAPAPFGHRVRLGKLKPGATYSYNVTQNGERSTGRFTTPAPKRAVRLIVLADSETEPESRGKRTSWPVPAGVRRPVRYGDGRYLVDQAEGLRANLALVADRRPDVLAVAGDLVESGGEQRDWDAFWGAFNGPEFLLLSRCVLAPVLGNHDVFAGPGGFGGYAKTDWAVAKYLAHFDLPDNGDPDHPGRYYRMDFGKLTLIGLDSTNGGENESASDTNWLLPTGKGPDHAPGSRQWRWAKQQLADARRAGQAVFVMFHHAPYSSGPHGWPAGPGRRVTTPPTDVQSGRPMRTWQGLFRDHGVLAVFSGHDEMYEHALVDGVHYFDVGIAGDGLRGPQEGLDNPHRVFLAHHDAPEVWQDGRLLRGGKHYGHVEVDLAAYDQGRWQAKLTGVYVLPEMDGQGRLTETYRRCVYETLTLPVPPPKR